MAEMSQITVKGAKQLPQYATGVAVFVKGVDAYENSRLGHDFTIATEEGKTISGTLSNKRVGAFLELIGEFGASNVHTFGLPYSPVSLVQTISDAEGESPLDVTKLYTVLVVQVVPTPTPVTGI